MADEPKKAISWESIKGFVKDYGQTVFTMGSLVFASGTLYADVKSIKEKTDRYDVITSTTEIQQARMSERITSLTDSQKVQSDATNKLADAVYSLSTQVARLEGSAEVKKIKRK